MVNLEEVHTYCCGAKLIHSRNKFVVCPICKNIARFPSGILRAKLLELAKALIGTELNLDDLIFGDSTIWHLDPDEVEKDLECVRVIRGYIWTFNESADGCMNLKELQESGRMKNAFRVAGASGDLELVQYA